MLKFDYIKASDFEQKNNKIVKYFISLHKNLVWQYIKCALEDISYYLSCFDILEEKLLEYGVYCVPVILRGYVK